MPFKTKSLTPDQITRVRQDYIDGKSTGDICREHNISKHKFYQCLDGGPKVGDGRMFEPLPRRKSGAAVKWGIKSSQRAALVRRLWQAADGQVRAIEGRLTLDAIEPAERERDARTMAVLVKTLRELNELDADRDKRTSKRGGNSAAAATSEVNYDDSRQIDDFRRELARRIEAIRSGAATDAADES